MTQSTSLTHEQPSRDLDNDTEMRDADDSAETARGLLDKRPDLPPRTSSTAQVAAAAAVAATTVTEKFVSSFWRVTTKPDTKPSGCPPPVPPHHTLPPAPNTNTIDHVPMPEVVHTEINDLPAETRPSPEALTAPPKDAPGSKAREEELLRKIKELETTIASNPSPDSVRALERSLQAESAQKDRAQADLAKRTKELDDMRKRWKQAARELDKTQSQNQGFYTVTDNYLIDLTMQLRYNIRNFAIQYFGSDGKEKVGKFEKGKEWEKYMATTTPESSDCEVFLLSEWRSSVIQAFIWRFLVGQVFDHFRWAGETGITMRNMCLFLRPEGQYQDSTEEINADEERKFQIWLASTTALILEAGVDPHAAGKFKEQNGGKVAALVDKVRALLDPFATTANKAYYHELAKILEECINLDREICRQVARVEWVFPDPGKEVQYDAKSMKLVTGEKLAVDKKKDIQPVRLVVCPAMKKRGKSNGDGFAAPASMLIPMEVSCEGPN
ncbi:uncharacterized protein BDV14DRAFT_112200 [Aspergillus stella-maris]|uniref:uncharacterized protein n=1 Tax=Aspergillus stella-maris TaxID=1810926 RepID=UPI003CCD3201